MSKDSRASGHGSGSVSICVSGVVLEPFAERLAFFEPDPVSSLHLYPLYVLAVSPKPETVSFSVESCLLAMYSIL
jgi:hypothetical protein